MASKISRTKSVISRIEDGTTRLDLEIAQKIADAFDTSVANVLGLEVASSPRQGFAEDVAPYLADADDLPIADGEYTSLVTTDALNKAGIQVGDIIVVDGRPASCRNPDPLQPVVVRYRPPENEKNPVTLLMQFVPPGLLITNSSSGNRMFDLDHDAASIVGVVKRVHRRYA